MKIMSPRISPINALLLLSGTQALRSNYVRIFKSTADAAAPAYELQTADVRLTLRDDGGVFSVDLLSTVHVAEREYYRDLQARAEQYDRTLFELIVDGSLVTTQQDEATGTQVRRLSTPLRAAPALKELAARNGLDTQVEALDCTRSRWVLADVTRRQLSVQEARLQQPGLASGRNTLAPGFGTLAAPLRLLLVGPTGSNKNSQGSALRPLLSFLPAPELCWLLDDWITAGGPELSPALAPLADALGRFDLGAARRLSFALTLAAGETTQEGSLAGALVRWRNARAVEEVEVARAAGCTKVALLYGALHMRDLRSRLLQRYSLVSVAEPIWRTAWSVGVPAEDKGAPGRSVLVLAAMSLVLLAVDAFDWIDCTEAVLRTVAVQLTPAIGALAPELYGGGGGGLGAAAANAAANAANAATDTPAGALLEALLYLARHALLYLALQRWAFEWDSRWWAVEADDEASVRLSER